jgi:hypothetical protein
VARSDSTDKPAEERGPEKDRIAVPETPTLAEPEELSPILASAEEQVQSVLDASHQAAQEILEGAKEEAARYIDQSRRARVARRREERRKRKNGGSEQTPPEIEAELTDPDPPVSETGNQVNSVLQATEQAASEIIESAKQEARRYLEECRLRAEQLGERRVSRIAAMVDELSRQVEEIRNQAQTLEASIARARMEMVEDLESEGDAYAEALAASAPDADALLQPLPPRGQSRLRKSPTTEGMRVLVMNMQASGADRQAIERQLRLSFGIQDPSGLLDELLTVGSRSR